MRAVLAALAVNLGIAVTKFIAFLVSGSSSMLAESVHSVADTFNQVLLLIGNARSDRSPTEEHPFGYGRESYFYGFVVAVLLFGVGGVFSVYDGTRKIMHPEPIHDPAIAFVVLAVSAVLESLSLRTALQEVNKVRPVRTFAALTRFIRRTKAPELVVVVLEDSAALLGLILAFAGVLVSVLTGSGAWDGVGSVGIGVLLIGAAFVVATETKSLLIGESASEEMNVRIVAAVEDGPEEFRVIHLRSTHLSRDALLVTAKISVPPSDSAESLAAGIDAAERRIRSAVPAAQTIYLEPDIYHPSRFDRKNPSIRAARRSRSRAPSPRPDRGSPAAPSIPPSPLAPPPSAPGPPPSAPGPPHTPAPEDSPDS